MPQFAANALQRPGECAVAGTVGHRRRRKILRSQVREDSDAGDFAEIEDITVYRVGVSYKFNFGGYSMPISMK